MCGTPTGDRKVKDDNDKKYRDSNRRKLYDRASASARPKTIIHPMDGRCTAGCVTFRISRALCVVPIENNFLYEYEYSVRSSFVCRDPDVLVTPRRLRDSPLLSGHRGSPPVLRGRHSVAE